MKKIISLIRGAALSFALFLAPSDVLAQTTAVEKAQNVTAEQIETARKWLDIIVAFFIQYGFQVLGGLIVLALGWFVAGYVAKLIGGLLEKKKVDVTVSKFIVGTVKLLIMTFVAIVAIGKFGIEITPLIAGLSVAGVGLSFALQGTLSNYAAGATLIFTKPFKVGDIIEVAGVTGEVIDLKMPRTELRAIDGELVVVPNKHIIGEIINNYSTFKRVDFNVGVSYSSDISKVIDIVKKIVKEDNNIVDDKEPKVGVTEFADSSITIYARAWCKQDNYLDAIFSVNKKIFDEFKKNGVEIPFPQRVVHAVKE
jgi:small conductance mechanosensitive channel